MLLTDEVNRAWGAEKAIRGMVKKVEASTSSPRSAQMTIRLSKERLTLTTSRLLATESDEEEEKRSCAELDATLSLKQNYLPGDLDTRPSREPDKIPELALEINGVGIYEAVLKSLDALDGKCLLYTVVLGCISIRTENRFVDFTVAQTPFPADDTAGAVLSTITRTEEHGTTSKDGRYIVFSRMTPDLEPRRLWDEEDSYAVYYPSIQVAFALAANGDPICQVQDVCSFFPLARWGLHFAVHGDFILDPQTGALDFTVKWNDALRNGLLDLAVHSAQVLSHRRNPTFCYSWHRWFDYDETQDVETRPGGDLHQLVVEKLKTMAVLRSPRSESAELLRQAPSSLYLCDEQHQYKEVSPFRGLQSLASRCLAPGYVGSPEDIRVLLSLGLRKLGIGFVLSELGELASKVPLTFKSEFLQQSREWHCALIRLIKDDVSAVRGEESEILFRQLISTRPIPTQDGDIVSSNTPHLRFGWSEPPVDIPTHLPLRLVDPLVASHPEWADFFTWMGVPWRSITPLFVCRRIIEAHGTGQYLEFQGKPRTTEDLVLDVEFLFDNRRSLCGPQGHCDLSQVLRFSCELSASTDFTYQCGKNVRVDDGVAAPSTAIIKRHSGHESSQIWFINPCYLAIICGGDVRFGDDFRARLRAMYRVTSVVRLTKGDHTGEGADFASPSTALSYLRNPYSRGLLLLLRDHWETCTQELDGKLQPRKPEFLLEFIDQLPVRCLDKQDRLMRDTVLSSAPGIARWFQHTRLPNSIDLMDRNNPSWLLFFDKFQNGPMTQPSHELWISYFKRLAKKGLNILSHLPQDALEGQAPSRIVSATAIVNQFLADELAARKTLSGDFDLKDKVVAEKVLLVAVRQGSQPIELRGFGADDTWFIPDLSRLNDRGYSPSCLDHCRDKLPLAIIGSDGIENQRSLASLCGKSRLLSSALRTTVEARGPTTYDVVRDFCFHRRIPALMAYLGHRAGSLQLPADAQARLEDIEIRFIKRIDDTYSIKATNGQVTRIFELRSKSNVVYRSQGSKVVIYSLIQVPAADVNQILAEAIVTLLSIPYREIAKIAQLLAAPLGSLPGQLDRICRGSLKFDLEKLGIPWTYSSHDWRGRSPEKPKAESPEEMRGRRGESYMNQWFRASLRADWHPSIHWTSHLRHHKDEGLPEFTASECEYADFTYIDTEGKVARILAEERSWQVVGMIPATLDMKKVTYHFEVKTTMRNSNKEFTMSAFQYRLAEYCSTSRNAAGLLTNVYVLVRLYDFKLGTAHLVTGKRPAIGKIIFLIDPWSLKAQGILNFREVDFGESRISRYSVTLNTEQRVTRKTDRPQSTEPAVDSSIPANGDLPTKRAAQNKDTT